MIVDSFPKAVIPETPICRHDRGRKQTVRSRDEAIRKPPSRKDVQFGASNRQTGDTTSSERLEIGRWVAVGEVHVHGLEHVHDSVARALNQDADLLESRLVQQRTFPESRREQGGEGPALRVPVMHHHGQRVLDASNVAMGEELVPPLRGSEVHEAVRRKEIGREQAKDCHNAPKRPPEWPAQMVRGMAWSQRNQRAGQRETRRVDCRYTRQMGKALREASAAERPVWNTRLLNQGLPLNSAVALER